MAIYKFTEVDNTRVSTVKNDNSNYVFLPINSTWGPTDKPVAIQSLAELKEYLGEDAEANSGNTTITSYQYATDIIKSGFCVLAKRLFDKNISTEAEQSEYRNIVLNYGSSSSTKLLQIEVGSEENSGYARTFIALNDTEGRYAYTCTEGEAPKYANNRTYTVSTEIVKDEYEMSYEDAAKSSTSCGRYVLTPTVTSPTSTPEEVGFTVYSNINDGVKALYVGTFGNNLKISFSTKLYGTDQKLLIMSTYDTADNSKLEETPLGLIKINQAGEDTFIPSNSVVSDYISINNITVTPVTSGTVSQDAYVYFNNGNDIERTTAIGEAPKAFDDEISNKWLYDIKFLCNGGLITESNAGPIAAEMAVVANTRQDCIAFIDTPKYETAKDTQEFLDNVKNKSTYLAAYAPWCNGTVIGSSAVVDIPASYYVITSMAKSFAAGNNICLPPAGVNRGVVNIKQPAFNIGNETMELWQGNREGLSYRINPIMNVRKYGYCIFGQRNLYELPYGTSSALQEIGVRLTLNEVKKWVRDVAVSLTFESNTNRTWNEFVSKVQKCLDKLVADGLLTQYSIERNSDITDQINTNTLSATIRVYVTRALENFDITVEVNSGDITFDEAYTG